MRCKKQVIISNYYATTIAYYYYCFHVMQKLLEDLMVELEDSKREL
jgi:hypothetical protein